MKKRIAVIALCIALFLGAAVVYGYKTGMIPQGKAEEAEPVPVQETEEAPSERVFSLEGRYYDSVSRTAYLKVEPLDEGYQGTVMWGPAAENFTEWTMTLFDDGNGHLCYNDCMRQHIVVDEAGKITVETEYEGGEGYFSIGNWLLKWDGAAEESCQSCIFEK